MTIDIVFSDEDLLVAYKPPGLPTVPLKSSSGDSLLSILALEYPEVLQCHGKNEWEGGILHRLDTPTRGLVIAARNQETYDYLYNEQRQGRIVKTYRAIVSEREHCLEGFPPFPFQSPEETSVVIESRFRPFGPKGSSVRPVAEGKRFQDGKIYQTKVVKEQDFALLCTITNGFRHQIRTHLSWSGYPIVGDDRYGGKANDRLELEAIALSFTHPRTRRELEIRI